MPVLEQVDKVIVYFPMLTSALLSHLQGLGVCVLAYISIYKTPVIPELEYATGFNGGSPTREETELNPYWRSVAYTGQGHELATSATGMSMRPFNKPAYKRGWYQQCLYRSKCADQVCQGVRGLLDCGLDGVFVDNVIDHTPCQHSSCPGRGQNPCKQQIKVLNTVYDRMKKHNSRSLVWLNAGRSHLFKGEVKADVYVTENFCYAEHLAGDRCYFAGHTLNSVKAVEQELAGVPAKVWKRLLGYTKLHRKGLSDAELMKRLEVSRDLAIQNGIMWTTRAAYLL
jgi:hypothetical protein